MKRLVLLLFIKWLFLSNLFTQNFNQLFYSSAAYDICLGMVEMDDGRIIALQQIHNFPQYQSSVIYGTVVRNSLPYSTYTSLWEYDENGNVLNVLPLPSTDSSFYYGYKLVKLSDGRLLIGGDVAKPFQNNSYNVFFAIIDSEIENIDELHEIKTFNSDDWFKGIVEKGNGNILIFGNQENFGVHDFLFELRKNGDIVNQSVFFNNGIYGSSNSYNYTMIYHNNAFYQHVGNGVGLVKVDSNYNVSVKNILSNTSSLSLASQGKSINNDKYFIHGSSSLSNVNDITIYCINKQDSIYQIFTDSTSYFGSTFYNTELVFIDSNFIYAPYDYFIPNDNKLLLYSITSSGNLNWKKAIELYNTGLIIPDDRSILHSILATKDKGCLISFGVKDEYGFADSYVLKLDSNGNQVDAFVTGIKDRQNIQFKISDFIVYPNPSKDLIQIESLNYKEEVLVEIYSVEGKLMLLKSFKNNTKIEINNFETGIYFYQMKTANGALLEEGKLMKE